MHIIFVACRRAPANVILRRPDSLRWRGDWMPVSSRWRGDLMACLSLGIYCRCRRSTLCGVRSILIAFARSLILWRSSVLSNMFCCISSAFASSAFILRMRCRSRGRLSVILVVIFGGIFLFENLIRIEKPFCGPVEFVVGIDEAPVCLILMCVITTEQTSYSLITV